MIKNIMFGVIGILIGIVWNYSDFDTNTYVVKNDMGGEVELYFLQADLFNMKNNTKVVLDGECYSACAIYTSVENICITGRVVLGLHSSYVGFSETEIDYSVESMIEAEYMNEHMFGVMPVKLQDIINNNYIPSVYNGNSPNDLFKLYYSDLKDIFETC